MVAPPLVSAVQHVVVDRDGWDRAIAAATVVATVIAIIALIIAIRARGDLVRERRADFELTILRDLADFLQNQTSVTDANVRIRMEMFPAEEFPWLGDSSGVRPNAEVKAERNILANETVIQQNGLERTVVREKCRAEVIGAIRRRLDSRPGHRPSL